jgi:hypothetical protein
VPAIKIGAKAVISMPEYPNRTFAATVEASSQSVDFGSGTTRMQLALDNAGGELMPGGNANVRMSPQRDAVPLHIPASALIFNQNGLRVATVGSDDKVLFRTVTIARDQGRDIELASGISLDDRIITAPPDGSPTAIPSALLASRGTAVPPRQAPKCGNEIFGRERRPERRVRDEHGPSGDNSPACRGSHLSSQRRGLVSSNHCNKLSKARAVNARR